MNNKSEIKYAWDRFQKQLQNPDPTKLRTGQHYSAYRELKQDPHLWSSIQQRKAAILTLDWAFDETGTGKAAKRIEAIGVKKLIRAILETVLFGFQPIEIMYDYDGEIYPKDIAVRKQENFVFDSNGTLQYYPQDGYEPQTPPPLKVICPTHEATRINPYGEALLSKCYWAVQYKHASQSNWVEFAEKFGFPYLKASYGRNVPNEDVETFKESIKDIARDNVIIFPDDMNIETETIKATTSKELFNGVINMCNTEISKAILSQTLTTEINIGSYAAAAIHYKIKREVIEGDIGIIEDAVNTIINYYDQANGRQPSGTKFKIIYTNSDNKEQIERDEKLVKMGVRLTDAYYQKTYGLGSEDFAL